MSPSVAIPLHFSLEFVGVAAAGGLLAWALYRRFVVFGLGAGALLVSQVLHTGQFVAGESPAAVLVMRLAGFVLLAAAARLEVARTPRASTSAAQVAATGSVGLAWATGAAAILAAAPAGDTPDRRIWQGGWVGLAAGELWFAVGGTGSVLLADDLGAHILRALGFGLLAWWTWRRADASLGLRMVAAFALVLFVVVVVVGTAVARVSGLTLADEQLDRLGVEVRAQEQIIQTTNSGVLGRAAEVAGTLSVTMRQGRDAQTAVQGILDSRILASVDLIVVVDRDGAVIAQAGAQPEELPALLASPVISASFISSGEAASSLEQLSDEVLFVAAAPVFGQGDQRPENVVAVAALGRRIDEATVAEIAERSGTTVVSALLDPGGEVLVASADEFRSADVPSVAVSTVQEDRIWRGTFSADDTGYLGALAPIERREEPAPVALLIAIPDAALVGAALDVSQALFASVLAAALLAVLIALWLSSRIVQPVLDLTATARRIEEGDLEARTDVDRPDEIGTLAHAFGSMTSTLRSTLASERDVRERMETIVSGMGEGLVAVDPDFRIVTFNAAAEEITGIAASEAIGQLCHDVYGRLTRTSDGRPICESICPLKHGGGSDGAVEATTPDGRRLVLAVTTSTLRDAEGNIVGGVDLLRDVTAERQAEQMKSNFLANISHELRTPLTPIKGFARMLQRKDLPKAKADEFLEEIIRSVDRELGLVQKLEFLASLDAGRLEVDPQPISPRGIVRGAVDRWVERAPDHRLRAVAPARLPDVLADPELIGRVLDELIENAVKFSPDGGPITVRAKDVDSGVELSVADKGVGMEAGRLDELVSEFTQGDASQTRRFGGLGVGLPLVMRVIRLHGSEVEVEGAVGKGTTFSFVLPEAKSTPARRKRGSRSSKKKAAKRSSGRRSRA